MTVNIIERTPVGHSHIGQRIVAREMILMLEHMPIGTEALLHEKGGEAIDEKGIKYYDKQ